MDPLNDPNYSAPNIAPNVQNPKEDELRPGVEPAQRNRSTLRKFKNAVGLRRQPLDYNTIANESKQDVNIGNIYPQQPENIPDQANPNIVNAAGHPNNAENIAARRAQQAAAEAQAPPILPPNVMRSINQATDSFAYSDQINNPDTKEILNKFNNALETLRGSYSNINAKANAINSNNDKISKSISNINVIINDLGDKITAVKYIINQNETELASTSANLKEINNLKKQNEDLRKQLQSALAKQQYLQNPSNSENDNVRRGASPTETNNDDLVNLQAQLEQCKNDKQTLDSNYSEIRQEYNNLLNSLQNATSIINTINNDLNNINLNDTQPTEDILKSLNDIATRLNEYIKQIDVVKLPGESGPGVTVVGQKPNAGQTSWLGNVGNMLGLNQQQGGYIYKPQKIRSTRPSSSGPVRSGPSKSRTFRSSKFSSSPSTKRRSTRKSYKSYRN